MKKKEGLGQQDPESSHCQDTMNLCTHPCSPNLQPSPGSSPQLSLLRPS